MPGDTGMCCANSCMMSFECTPLFVDFFKFLFLTKPEQNGLLCSQSFDLKQNEAQSACAESTNKGVN